MHSPEVNMIFEIDFRGVGLKIRKLELRFFYGDLYIHIPGYLEVAWNHIGFFEDKHYQNKGKRND